MDWIRHNVKLFQLAAMVSFLECGRGAIVVNTEEKVADDGFLYGYVPQEEIEQQDDEDAKRMVQEYDPVQELVIMLLKEQNRISTYRLRPLSIRIL